LVNCVVYRAGRRVAEIPAHEIANYRGSADSFVWVALREPSAEELAAMQVEFDLPPLAVEDAAHGNQRPKIEEYGENLFVVLHLVESSETGILVGEADVFVGRDYVLSVRTGGQQGFRDVRARSEREPELLSRGPAYVLYALMDAVIDRYFPVLDKLEEELELVEERIFAGESPRANIETLYGLRRQLATLKHATRPMLDAVGKLYGGRVPALCVVLQDYFRDVSDHLARINERVDELDNTLTAAMSVSLSFIALRDHEVTMRLASYAALVAVPTMVAGVYGMNFQYMPELDWTLGYPLSLLLMVGVDAVLFWRLRKAGWL
jgi:magnesium transporter